VKKIPKKFDLLVGGFPCQDYSVAKTLSHAKGLKGKKGVLWWEILRLVELHKPKFIFLENVDRLLKSPSNQRGRDFAVMLRTLSDVGYVVEWRVVNAAEYGFPQRRIRVFIVARKAKSIGQLVTPFEYVTQSGILAKALPVEPTQLDCAQFSIDEDAEKVSKFFNKGKREKSPFLNTGMFLNGIAYTIRTDAAPKLARFKTLGDVLQPDSEIDESFFIPQSQLKEWKYLKGAKSIDRVHKGSGKPYKYSEGSMAFPDLLTNPSRTILTGEGGSSPSRFKHIIQTKKGYRRLSPVELERLNGFPDNWTCLNDSGERVSDAKRAFFMGNALVIGLIEKVGKVIADELREN
jgi:DNA (cytosine-5)-methyltransferase 1